MSYSLELAREVKRTREVEGVASGTGVVTSHAETEQDDDLTKIVMSSGDALDTEDEEVDPSFELDSSMMSDTDYMVATFCEDWISHLDRDDRVSLSLFLCFRLARYLDIGETKAAELGGMMVGKSDKTVRE